MDINPKILEEFGKSLQQLIKPFEEILDSHKESFKQVSNRIADMPFVIKSLSEYGWFINFKMLPREIILLGSYMKKEDIISIDHYMMKYINDNLDYILTQIVLNYEKRKVPLQEAIEAHRNSLFYLSIPVILSQTEGIFKDYFKIGIFSTKNKIPETSEWISTLQYNSILDAFLNPLNFKESIRNHQKNNFVSFTRNDVLHGENYEYGTEVNSAKSISFMFYIFSLIEIINKK